MPDPFSPYLVAVPLVTLTFALYGAVARQGARGYVGGAAAGFLWSLLAGLVAGRLGRDPSLALLAADASLFGCVVALGLLAGSGVLYVLLFRSVLGEASTTYSVLSALMRPTVPFYIAVNSAVEVLLLPLVLFLNWDAGPHRRWIVTAAAAIYVAQRAWTYLVYAGQRLAAGTSPLSEADVAWYRRTLAADYRFAMSAAAFALFSAAAFLDPPPA